MTVMHTVKHQIDTNCHKKYVGEHCIGCAHLRSIARVTPPPPTKTHIISKGSLFVP
jgi:hypothetical protein